MRVKEGLRRRRRKRFVNEREEGFLQSVEPVCVVIFEGKCSRFLTGEKGSKGSWHLWRR